MNVFFILTLDISAFLHPKGTSTALFRVCRVCLCVESLEYDIKKDYQ